MTRRRAVSVALVAAAVVGGAVAFAATRPDTYSVRVHGRVVTLELAGGLRINGRSGEDTPPIAPGIYVASVPRDPALARLGFLVPRTDVPVVVRLHFRDAERPIEAAGVWDGEAFTAAAAGTSPAGPLTGVTVRVEPPGQPPLERRVAWTGDGPIFMFHAVTPGP